MCLFNIDNKIKYKLVVINYKNNLDMGEGVINNYNLIYIVIYLFVKKKIYIVISSFYIYVYILFNV